MLGTTCQSSSRVVHDRVLLANALALKAEKGSLNTETWSQCYEPLSLQKVFMSVYYMF